MGPLYLEFEKKFHHENFVYILTKKINVGGTITFRVVFLTSSMLARHFFVYQIIFTNSKQAKNTSTK